MLITCGLISTLNSLKIPYCIVLINESNFKIIIKSFEDPYFEESLQIIIECILLSTYKN